MPLLAVLLLLGCPRPVVSDFQAARKEALQDPGPAPAHWAPDAVLHLSHDALTPVVSTLLASYGTLEGQIDATVATLAPALVVQDVRLGRGDCADCLGVGTTLEGQLGVDTALGRTSVALSIDAAFDAAFLVEEVTGGWTVQLALRKLHDLDVDVGGIGLGYARGAVRDWVDTNLLQHVPPQEITTFGRDALPVRALRIRPVTDALQIHILTAMPDARPLTVTAARPEGWRLDVSPSTLTALAAAEAYRAGPVSHDVVPIPTSLALRGDRFTLGLRLWRLKGRGWWRDYEVQGTLGVDGRRVVLSPTGAEKTGGSRGAALVDPLAALGQGVILSAITDALETTMPAAHREDHDGLRTRVRATEIRGASDRVIVEGALTVREPPPQKPRRKRGKRGKRGKRR